MTNDIRMGRMWIAGLAAGLILNIGEAALHAGILGDATTAAYTALNRTVIPNPIHLASLILVTFAQGIAMAWLYAIIRPRLGSRVGAVACVSLVAWVLSSLYSAVYLHSGLSGLFPLDIVWVPVAWELVEYPLGALAAAVIYRE